MGLQYTWWEVEVEENTGGEPKVLKVEISDGTTRLPCVVDAAEAVVELEIKDDDEAGGV